MARHAHEGEASAVAGKPPSAGGAAPAGGGPAAVEHRLKRTERQPERSCIVTREVRPPSELIRFVLSPDGTVTPDIGRALPGRGVWVTAGRGYVEEAVKRKAFARALKAQARTPADLADLVSRLLRKGALQALSLANKGGAVIAGFEKVRAAVASGEAAALVEAADGSLEGRRKLLSVRQAPPVDAGAGGLAEELPVIDLFASADLDLALGRSHVIHAALLQAPAGLFALTRCLRFRRFELIEKHASGGAERRGASRESRPIVPQDRRLND